jgi:NADPH:quinone reductase-like Zn-dependent oxidoreductase
MKAIYLNGHGGNEVVQVGEMPVPVAGHGEVLVRMQASTLNQVDLYMRNSGAGITHQLPQIMGLDGAGVIDSTHGDAAFSAGQRVLVHPGITCGRCEFCLRGQDVLCTRMALLGEHRHGTWAEYLALPARNVFPTPGHLSDLQAAALGVNHLTAWRMVVTQARLQAWETVLIIGIGGGVSLAALQIAKALGARTVVTSRHADKLARARELGADVLIDSSTQDVAKAALAATQGRGVDVVIENVGAAVWSSALKSLVRGGRIVTCGATSGDQPGADLRRLFIRQLQVMGSTLGSLHEMQDLLAFVNRHQLSPVMDQVFEMDQVHAALDRLDSSQQFGKVGLKLTATA